MSPSCHPSKGDPAVKKVSFKGKTQLPPSVCLFSSVEQFSENDHDF